MNAVITPSELSGSIRIPSSKSMAHRAIICAALATGVSRINNIDLSKDIQATLNAVCELGAQSQYHNHTLYITGINSPSQTAKIDCGESGSTLRFLMPIVAALHCNTEFIGHGALIHRPIAPYKQALTRNGVEIQHSTQKEVIETEGQLHSGIFFIDGTVSSQFISGLLFALPLLNHTSEIQIQGILESKPYVDMTIDVLKTFGIDIYSSSKGYIVPGNQEYCSQTYTVEGDYSQAAFFEVAGCCGQPISIEGLNPDSIQGDKAMLKLISRCGGLVEWNDQTVTISPQSLCNFSVDITHTPDLAPAIAVLGCLCPGRSTITGIRRLKLKESDRVTSIVRSLSSLGANIQVENHSIVINGIANFCSGTAKTYNDHRIAMACAIAASFASGSVVIRQAECVEKSYPTFYQDYRHLGGMVDGIGLE